MKKLLSILFVVGLLSVSFSCTEEEVKPASGGEGGTSRATGF